MSKTPVPDTLVGAHEYLQHKRPSLDEKPPVWAAFHRLCAEVYAHVATTDIAHKYEAQYWAGASIRQARQIEDGDDRLVADPAVAGGCHTVGGVADAD